MSKSPQVCNGTYPQHSVGQHLLFVRSVLHISTSIDMVPLEIPRSSRGLGWIQPGARYFKYFDLMWALSTLRVSVKQ